MKLKKRITLAIVAVAIIVAAVIKDRVKKVTDFIDDGVFHV